MAQINITKGTTPQGSGTGKLGLSFDTNNNLIIIDENGGSTIVGTGQGGLTNIIAELGVGLEADLPAIVDIGFSYVCSDTFKIYTVKDAISWDISDLEKSQFVLNTLSAPLLYQFDGTELVLLQAIETAQSILDKIGDGATISSLYLPSYVDDVVEVANFAALPVTGEASKIYITLDNNFAYRWTGTAYFQISSTPTYASQAEAEAGVENTKVITSLRVLQSWVYQVSNYVNSALNTVSKTVVGAINEILGKFAGVYTDRGEWDASTNTFPDTGGSGTAGAVLRGDTFTISVSGDTLFAGMVIRALQDTPGQIANNWYIPTYGVGYVPEDVANKEITTLDNSTIKYPSNSLVKTLVDSLQNEIDNISLVGQAILYYLENSASDISGYEQLLKTPLTTSEVIEIVNLDTNEVVIDSYATPAEQPATLSIPAGLWTCHAHVQFSSLTGSNYVHFDVYKRDAGGTETLLFRMSSGDVVSTELVEYNLQEVQSAFSLTLADRLVVKLSAQTTGGAKTAALHYSGSTNFAFISPPGSAGTSNTFSSGLTEIAGAVKLGGTDVIAGTKVGTDSSGFIFGIALYNLLTLLGDLQDTGGGKISIDQNAIHISTQYGQIDITSSGIALIPSNSTKVLTGSDAGDLSFYGNTHSTNPNEIIFSDYRVIKKGIELAADYSAMMTALSLINKGYVDTKIIYSPATQPAIVAGTPSILPLDCNSREQCLFESRYSVGTRSINEDFTYQFSNITNTKLIHDTLSLTGTRIITMPSGTIVSNPSSIGTWDGTALTISAGTDDIIEFDFLYDVTESKWKLIVGGVNL